MEAALFVHLPIETLQERLAEALDAYHQITILKRRVQVSQGDRRTQFSEANISELSAYISSLQAALTAKQTGGMARRRPIYMGVG